ncbi:hypothetical protein CEXT_399781 [Caerostris extrusa]|uniref:Uncharacterized protein n=1 Tax=Caerostris extrusa TaxID=172846 RepID=A0AAV4X965_CAEEX|nr:hypothetical protein CEXT_399781 [Caerostris extrusa]
MHNPVRRTKLSKSHALIQRSYQIKIWRGCKNFSSRSLSSSPSRISLLTELSSGADLAAAALVLLVLLLAARIDFAVNCGSGQYR